MIVAECSQQARTSTHVPPSAAATAATAAAVHAIIAAAALPQVCTSSLCMDLMGALTWQPPSSLQL
jgi:hypothetical protein